MMTILNPLMVRMMSLWLKRILGGKRFACWCDMRKRCHSPWDLRD